MARLDQGPLRTSVFGLLALALSVFSIAGPAASATTSVNCGAGGNLQHKINGATPGSTVLIKGTCKGTFHVTGKGLTLRGNPTATLDGQKSGSTLTIDATGKTVHLLGLTITRGPGFAQRWRDPRPQWKPRPGALDGQGEHRACFGLRLRGWHQVRVERNGLARP